MCVKMMCVWVCVVVCLLGVSVMCQDVEYTVQEEVATGFRIGNLKESIAGLEDQVQFSILTEGNPHSELFEINQNGDLLVKSRMDRESLCPFQTTCNLMIEIVVQSDTIFKNYKVKIIVRDVNDNAPKFPVQSRRLDISESSPVGSAFSIPGPSDNDTDSNHSLQAVDIIPSAVPFNVTFTKNIDGTSVVSLILTQKIDRETRDIYVVNLVAKDGGTPPRSSSMELRLHVTDINDNPPVFTSALYNATINESTPLDTVILKVNADDNDEGDNAKVFYRLSSHQADEISRHFSMNQVTGEITLKQQLNSGRMRVIIEASDHGEPSKIAQAIVDVEIRDTINNPPSITINILSGTNTATVSESVRIGFPLAHIKVLDPDTGANSMVTCTSQTRGFDIKSLELNEYKVVVAAPLDYEVIKNYSVAIYCQDAGEPKLNTTAEFVVSVIDANDNSPVFVQDKILLNIAENNGVGDTLVQLAATDNDSGSNSRLSFFLSKEASVNFTLQTQLPDTAIVKANIQFDREDLDHYELKVYVVDGGEPQKTATATVTINILDINDERPAFWQQAYTFNISENLPEGTAVGNVSAFDLDTEEGGKFSLTLARYQPSDPLPFTILQNGTIISKVSFDRESTSVYTFQAVATDKGTTPLSGMSQVTVVINDLNDNDPSFVFPNDENFSVSVFIPTKAESVVVKLQAKDEDSKENSEIKFHARDLNSSGLFEIHNTTGEIFTTRDIEARMIGTYYLVVMISNNTPNSRSVSQRLKISVTQRGDAVAVAQNDQYIAIVIVLVCITLLIAAAVLLALCYLRKRDKERQLKQVYKTDDASSYGIQNPVTESDIVSSDNSTMDKMSKQRKLDDLDSSSSTMNGHIITGKMNGGPSSTRSYSTNPDPGVPDREHQRQNQLMSFRLHQALQRFNSESAPHDHNTTAPHEHSKIMAANAKVLEWREAQKRVDDFHSTSSGEVTTGDSGHGSDEDSHVISDRTGSPQKIRLGVGAIKPRGNMGQMAPPRSKVSPIKSTKMPNRGRNGPNSYPSHVNLPHKKEHEMIGMNPYLAQMSPRSDTIDDGDDTTTSGSYSITVEDIKDLPDFDYAPVKDVYV